MLAIDTSALMAVLLDEPDAGRVIEALSTADTLVISAGTLAEALIVADRRGLGPQMRRMVDGLGLTVAPVSAAAAGRITAAYERWGRGQDPAGLNFGDCFAYEAAREQGCPLLFVGEDFSRTDLTAA